MECWGRKHIYVFLIMDRCWLCLLSFWVIKIYLLSGYGMAYIPGMWITVITFWTSLVWMEFKQEANSQKNEYSRDVPFQSPLWS
jgi:hypothetical protein